jgi:PAS domain S-box-containing protein
MSAASDIEKISKKYEALFESNMIGIVISDLDEKIVEANDVFLHLVGYTKKDLESGALQWSTITPKKYDEIDQKKIHELLQRGRIIPFEKEYIHKEKGAVPVLVGAALIHSSPPLSICFALDISEQKKLERKKDEFIGTVSHELRTPLAVLKTYAELLKLEILEGDSIEQMMKSMAQIETHIHQLAALITDLLKRAQYGDTGAHIQKKLFNLSKTIGRAVADMQMTSAQHTIVYTETGEFIVRGDEDQIMQVTLNLIRNAVQYSPAHTTINISVMNENDHAKVCVQDFGIGIAPENIPHIFERYYRAHQHAPGGAGIGLYICREIIQHHQGVLSVSSQPQKGSTFCYTLPLVSPQD